MNRREFVRTAIATTTLMAVGLTGMFEIAAKAGADQTGATRQQLQLPPIGSETSQSSTESAVSSSSSVSSQASSQTSSVFAPSSTSSSQISSVSVPSGYVLVAQSSSLGEKSSAYFTHPKYGSSILLSLDGQWRAFSAVCTHRPCTVAFQSSELYCPCHGATFSATDGSVTRGPARTRLGEYGVMELDGGVYVTSSYIN